MTVRTIRCFLAVLAVALSLGAPAAAQVDRFTEDVTWEGRISRDGDSIILAGATLGFLRHNFPPARIFLGDVAF